MINRNVLKNTKWTIKTLGEVSVFLDHLRKPITKSDRIEGEYNYYGANGKQGTINDYIFDYPTILLAEDGGNFGNFDRTIAYKVDGKYWVNNHAHVIKPNEEIINFDFLLRVLEKYDVRPFINGATRQKLNKSDALLLEIPLPSLPEQQRIANILDKAEAINQKRAQVLVLCDEFLRATFLDMFGHHFSSKGYPSSTKKSIALLTDYIDYRGKTPKKTEYGIPLITAKNVRKGYVDEEPREFISEDLYDDWMTRGLPLKNDVLFTTEAPLGNVALLGEYEKVAVGQRLVSLRCKEEVTPIYFMYALLDRYTQQLIFQRSSGSTVKGIRTKELYQIEIPTPPIELQQKFSSIVEKINGIKTRIQEAQELPLFDALSQQAFKGELTQ